MNNFFTKFYLILWYILIGVPIAIIESIIGVLCFITVVGKPLALKHFEFIKLIFKNKTKVVAVKYARNIKSNTFYGIFGGFITCGIYYIMAIILTITIIFYPIASMLFKLVKYNCCPFSAELLNQDEYSTYKDTSHDISLITNRIFKNKDQIISINNRNVIVIDYVKEVLRKEDNKNNSLSYLQTYRKFFKIRQIASFVPLIALLFVFYANKENFEIILASIFVLFSLFLTIFIDVYYINKLNNLFFKNFSNIFDEFQEKDKQDYNKKSASYCHMLFFKEAN